LGEEIKKRDPQNDKLPVLSLKIYRSKPNHFHILILAPFTLRTLVYINTG